MQESSEIHATPPPVVTPSLPLNLGLNDGTYAPKACVEALRQFDSTTAFRNYTTPGNDPLREVIADIDGVKMENIFLHNGSGPILKLAIPHLLRKRVLASPFRTLRHLVKRDGFPIITPRFTYSKIPKKAAEGGMHVEMLPLEAEKGFELDLDHLDSRIRRAPGLVYLVNPNNPTGNLLIRRPELVALLERYPEARFWIDEAYVQYIDPSEHGYLSDLIPHHPNLLIGRSFSFAYGLAAARIGYILAAPDFVSELEAKVTDYRLGSVQEAIGIAALKDEEHLPFLRRATAQGREVLRDGVARFDGIESFPSEANFILCRFADGRSGKMLADGLAARGVRIKIFEPACGNRYDPYFRLTVGLPGENEFLLEQMAEVLG